MNLNGWKKSANRVIYRDFLINVLAIWPVCALFDICFWYHNPNYVDIIRSILVYHRSAIHIFWPTEANMRKTKTTSPIIFLLLTRRGVRFLFLFAIFFSHAPGGQFAGKFLSFDFCWQFNFIIFSKFREIKEKFHWKKGEIF